MSRTFRTLLIVLIVLILGMSLYVVNATDDDTVFEADSTANLEDTTSTSSDESSSDDNNNVIRENASDGSIQTLNPTSTITSVSNKDNYSNANLALNNILCIILISIGVLLILFAIAILIRLKR